MKAVSGLLPRLPVRSSLFAAVVPVIGLVFALPASAPAASFTFTPIAAPGASSTEAFGINATGQIVGAFVDDMGIHGVLDTGGVLTPIDVPGASRTEAFGINDKGQIVGFFDNATGEHGFLATLTAAPGPSTLVPLVTGLAFGAAWKRIRKRSGLDRETWRVRSAVVSSDCVFESRHLSADCRQYKLAKQLAKTWP